MSEINIVHGFISGASITNLSIESGMIAKNVSELIRERIKADRERIAELEAELYKLRA